MQQYQGQKRLQEIDKRRASTYKQISQVQQRLAYVGTGPHGAQRREQAVQELEALDAQLRFLQSEKDEIMSGQTQKDLGSTNGAFPKQSAAMEPMDEVLNPQRLVEAVLGSMTRKAKEAKEVREGSQ